jgi:hypothetical protein
VSGDARRATHARSALRGHGCPFRQTLADRERRCKRLSGATLSEVRVFRVLTAPRARADRGRPAALYLGRREHGEGGGGAEPRDGPTRLVARGEAPPPLVFHRGAHAPYATRWFGVTSIGGHARNFVASAIAAESIDSRDWMRPPAADEILSQVARVLGGDPSRPTLVEAVNRPVWVDFVADTGDDHDVSQAVGRMLFAPYALDEDGERGRILPRGDVLLFGGDTAYPVATGEEIARRVVAPWNEVLREGADPPRPRVLLGIPGNHDWYDGLDGFARLFRRRPAAGPGAAGPQDGAVVDESAPSRRRRRVRRRTGAVARQLHLDEVGGVVRLVVGAWAATRALWSGTKIVRPRRLVLGGYEAVQEASFWALPLAPGLEAWGVDRQLGRLDYRQRLFFADRRRAAPGARLLFVAPDPALAFGERHDPGARMLSACRLSLQRDRVFYLCGDMHHYERRAPGASSLHVIAGGGGAFLHGTRISRYSGEPPACVWPNASTSRRLLSQVPLKLTFGGAGFMLHIAFAALAAAELGASERGLGTFLVVAGLVAVGLAAALYRNLGHHKAHPRLVASVALPFGIGLGLLPVALRSALSSIVPTLESDMGTLVACTFAGPLGIGLFLALVAVLGIEHQQAFSVLSHPGFKHFVRMCIHADGRIEAWVIGKDDPLGPGEPRLIDHFEWPP